MAEVFGIEVDDLPEGSVATGVVAIVDVMTPDGDQLVLRGAGMSDESEIGALTVVLGRKTRDAVDAMDDDDPSED